jgi:hypothetical protein
MMILRPRLVPPWWIFALLGLGAGVFVVELARLSTLTKPFVADDIIATTTLTSQGTTTSNGLIEAKAQIQVDGPAATTANVRTCNGSPNGSVIGTRGSLCMDPTTPAVWVNTNGGTTWIQIGPVFSATAGGSVPASGGVAGTFLRADGVWAAPSAGGGLTSFSFGTDGAVNLDGVSTVTIQGISVAPAANVYTLPAGATTIYGTNVTIAGGVTVKSSTSGLQIIASGTLSGTGTIDVSGASAVSNTNGAGRAQGFYGASKNGGTGATAGNAGNGQSSGSCPTLFPTGVTSGGAGATGNGGAGTNGPGMGRGGSGGGGGGNLIVAGGNGGNNGQCTHINAQNVQSLSDLIVLDTGMMAGGGGTNQFESGTGGGGGASGTDGTNFGLGGGGGAAGGMAFVMARTCSGSITINAAGGNGANGAAGSTLPGLVAGGGGGGGGGAGGIVGVVCGSGTAPTIIVTGGIKGTGGVGKGGGGNGGDGGNGGVGFSGSLVLN